MNSRNMPYYKNKHIYLLLAVGKPMIIDLKSEMFSKISQQHFPMPVVQAYL